MHQIVLLLRCTVIVYRSIFHHIYQLEKSLLGFWNPLKAGIGYHLENCAYLKPTDFLRSVSDLI